MIRQVFPSKPKARKKPVKSDTAWRTRYREAHQAWQLANTPNAVEVGGYVSTTYPRVTTGNGLTQFMVNFLTWNGWRASRISVEGRLVEKETRSESGAIFKDKKFIKSSTSKGYADVDATIKGRSCKFEAKGTGDRPREKQLEMQVKERKSGGLYEFIYTPDQFYTIYDNIINSTLF